MSDVSYEQREALKTALRIVKKAGKTEEFRHNGENCTVMTYMDPWGGGLIIRYGGPNRGPWHLTVDNLNEDLKLFSAVYVGDRWILQEYDETTAWTVYLSACDADVREKYGAD